MLVRVLINAYMLTLELLAIRPTTGENVLGFLLFGVNVRRPYDDDYESFVRPDHDHFWSAHQFAKRDTNFTIILGPAN